MESSGRAPARIILKTKVDRAIGSSSPAPGNVSVSAPHARRARPETSHQRAVNLNRKMRIDNILHKKLVKEQNLMNKAKRKQGFNRSFMAMTRIVQLPDDYDSEEESSWGSGGIVPNPEEMQDYGGEALSNKKVFDRIWRRLGREETRKDPYSTFAAEFQAMAQKKKEQQNEIPMPDERYKRPLGTGRRARGGRRSQVQKGQIEVATETQEEQMNDIEMDMGGEPAGAEEDSGDDSVDDSDAGDETEDGMVE